MNILTPVNPQHIMQLSDAQKAAMEIVWVLSEQAAKMPQMDLILERLPRHYTQAWLLGTIDVVEVLNAFFAQGA